MPNIKELPAEIFNMKNFREIFFYEGAKYLHESKTLNRNASLYGKQTSSFFSSTIINRLYFNQKLKTYKIERNENYRKIAILIFLVFALLYRMFGRK